MILISLMLAATPPAALKPESPRPPKTAVSRRARPVARSKRLIELEAVVSSLSSRAPEPARSAGPEGL